MIEHNNNSTKVIGPYKIIKRLDDDGYSQVYLVEDSLNNNKYYVLKAIKNPNNKYRLQNEINLYKTIGTHRNILPLHKVFKEEGKVFFLFDYIKDGDVTQYIEKHGQLSNDEILLLLSNMLDVLLYCQKHSVIHTDIKQTNILKDKDKYVLADWILSEQVQTVKTFRTKQEYDIYAPEVFKGEYDNRSDIYALGCTLYYLCTNKLIYGFDEKTTNAYRMFAHCTLQPDVSAIESQKFKYLITRMTEKDPDRRITLAEFKEVLYSEDNEYYNVDDGSKNYDEYQQKSNFELYSLLDKENIVYAQYYLGLHFVEEKNYEKACFYFEISAKKGFIKSMHYLGLYYLEGLGVDQNLEEAFYWFNEASSYNHERASYKLGYFYEQGILVKKDIEKAISLYIKSASHGYKEAYTKLHEVKKNLYNPVFLY